MESNPDSAEVVEPVRIVSLMEGGPAGLTLRTWVLPPGATLEPADDWEEQETPPMPAFPPFPGLGPLQGPSMVGPSSPYVRPR